MEDCRDFFFLIYKIKPLFKWNLGRLYYLKFLKYEKRSKKLKFPPRMTFIFNNPIIFMFRASVYLVFKYLNNFLGVVRGIVEVSVLFCFFLLHFFFFLLVSYFLLLFIFFLLLLVINLGFICICFRSKLF